MKPSPPQNLRLAVVDGSSLRIRWDAPADDGGSAIEGYDVRVSHPRLSPSIDESTRFYSPESRLLQVDEVRRGVTYTVSVKAWNGVAYSEPVSQKITTPAPSCPTGGKYERRREGGLLGIGRHWRIYSRQGFDLVQEQVDGLETGVGRGAKGGVVFDAESLSQAGCSWIFDGAAVEGDATVTGNAVMSGESRVKDDAKISGNAVIIDAVVSDHAQVSGNAEVIDEAVVSGYALVTDNARVSINARVTGDNPGEGETGTRVGDNAVVTHWAVVSGRARISGDAEVTGVDTVVTGNARVSGNAVISGGARVHGNAQVRGDAQVMGGDVSGDVMVTGNAVVVEGTVVDGSDCGSLGGGEVCIYDGTQELERFAQQSLNELYNETKVTLDSCSELGDEAERLALDLVYPKPDEQGRANQNVALGSLMLCETVDALWEFADLARLGRLELAVEMMSGFLGLGWFARLRPFVRSLWGIFDAGYALQNLVVVLRLKGATTEAIERRQELCSRLGRPLSCTVPGLRD